MTGPRPQDAIGADQAREIFTDFSKAEDLALQFPADGCYARTHMLWAFAASAADPLWMEQPDHPGSRIQWRYHVAPALLVRETEGKVQEMVFDPILFNRPVSVEEWKNALHDTPTLIRTALGEPPFPTCGGSGYWPALDPLEGPDLHARETLEDYRERKV